MEISDVLSQCTGFEWDLGNIEKNWLKHKVSQEECEQIFFNVPLVAAEDTKHSDTENRFYALGQTDHGRLLFLIFTVRSRLIRVISARVMNRKERRVYEETNT